MPQVTIYMPDEVAKKARRSAREQGVSLSRWISRAVEAATTRQWPEAVRALAGAWRDFPTAEQLRKAQPKDSRREAL